MRHVKELAKQLGTRIKLKIDALLAFMRSLRGGTTDDRSSATVVKIFKNERHYLDEASEFLKQHHKEFRLLELNFNNNRNEHIYGKICVLGATVMFYVDERGKPVYRLLSELGEYEFEYVREHALNNDQYGVLEIMHRYENLYAYLLASMTQI